MAALGGIASTRCALLAMDFQQSILGFHKDPSALLAAVGRAIGAVRRAKGRIGYVRVGYHPPEIGMFPLHSAMGARIRLAGAKMHADSPTTAIVDAITPEPGDFLLRKTRVGSFSTTDLHLQLTAAGVKTLILAGVHTSGVVLSTVREAHDLDYRLVVLSDACADPDPDVHEFLVGCIFPKQAEVCTVAELEAALFREPRDTA